nr:PREDICTED: F-box/FBD/LRR-repeat protein At1g13570-like isoform X1 [Daucus carota subsp. sativus]
MGKGSRKDKFRMSWKFLIAEPLTLSDIIYFVEYYMGDCPGKDFLSDLPHGIIERILTKLPIRDAVRTSVLSSQWRYLWATMTQLVFDENCVFVRHGSTFSEKKLFNCIMQCLFLHNGPIKKFSLSTSYWDKYPEMDQCLLFLSRKGIKELVLDIDLLNPLLPAPSAIFFCQQLISLTLCGFELKPPRTFQGFPCLKYLNLEFDAVTTEVVESLISGCPLLEKLKFLNVDHLAFTVRGPNLKHLILEGDFKYINLEHAPLLVAISVEINTEVSGSNILLKVPVTYHCLKFIELKGVNFKGMNEVLYVLHLILQSPNLQELQVSAATRWTFFKAYNMDFWERECPTDFTFKHLKIVKMSGVSHKKDMDFIKFVLRSSPVLEVMRVSYDEYLDYRKRTVMEYDVLHSKRASPTVNIKLFG